MTSENLVTTLINDLEKAEDILKTIKLKSYQLLIKTIVYWFNYI